MNLHRLLPGAWPPPTGDLVAGLAVAAVLMPQSLAYAQLAGMPPGLGLLAGTAPPIVAAFFACSPYLQTGPVAVTSLLTFGALSTHATPGSARYVQLGVVLALIVGIVRITLGLVRAGAITYLMSEPVLLGFVQGAALLICLSQVPALVGSQEADGGIVRAASEALADIADWSPATVAFAGAAAVAIVLLRRLGPLVPAALAVVVAAIVVSRLAGYEGETLGEVTLDLPSLEVWELSPFPWSMVVSGVVVALVGLAEPVAIARTFAVQDRQRWNADQELVGQGVANLASAVCSGLPVGGSFSRSTLNRQAGAQTRWSGAVTGLVVLASLPIVAVLAPLPSAVLAAVVVLSVTSLFKPRSLIRIFRLSRPQAVVAWATLAATVAFSPNVTWAVLVGVGLALVVHLARERDIDIDIVVSGDRLVFRPRGVLWFVSSRVVEDAFARAIAEAPGVRRVEISLRGVGRVDLTGALTVRRMMRDARDASLTVQVLDVPPRARRWTRSLLLSETEPL